MLQLAAVAIGADSVFEERLTDIGMLELASGASGAKPLQECLANVRVRIHVHVGVRAVVVATNAAQEVITNRHRLFPVGQIV